MPTVYITTPIYYVNDRPHIGHCYTTLLADAMGRATRLIRGEHRRPIDGGEVFVLTGTDEHAEKVVTSAAAHSMSPQNWADRNATEFRHAFDFMNCAYDDFIRTTEDRHKSKVVQYIRELQSRGDIYLGDYEGWFDESQEEYLTETAAKEAEFKSPVTGRPLVRRREKNYFFRLSKFQDKLLEHIRANPGFIRPEARKNEVLGRLKTELQDIPISRAVSSDPASQWGILMPDDPEHRIYVWIDALFNYLTVVDTGDRGRFWPATVHFIAKDILWFHAVIWPCLLMALGRDLPGSIYSHAYWVREGRKMSKSLGNFVTIEVLREYADKFTLDGLRWYLLTQGPMSATDADFSHSKFVEVYNAELANGIGNSTSRVGNMIAKYFDGVVPEVDPAGYGDWPAMVKAAVERFEAAIAVCDLPAALNEGVNLVRKVDGYINDTQPFKLAKTVDTDPAAKGKLGSILYNCAEALRAASLLLAPAAPQRMMQLWASWGCVPPPGVPLAELAAFGGSFALRFGGKVSKGEPLFMRADPAEPAPGAPPAG